VNKLLRIILFTFLTVHLAQAQIEINGSADFELSYGGKESSFTTNEITNNFRDPHMGINQLNLFLFSQIDESWFFNGRIQWDTWGTGTLNSARITLASLAYEPEDSPFSLTFGRFVSPFGLYPRRQLASENIFAAAPMAYGYFLNISDTHGYLAADIDKGTYGSSNAGLTMAYFGGYNTGFMTNWIVVENLFDISLAIANVAPASQRNYSNTSNFSVISRFGFQPVIYWQQGISIAYGGFKWDNPVSTAFDDLDYNQTLIGMDFIVASGYFELSGEFLYSIWNTVASDSTGIDTKEDGTLLEYEMNNYSYYVDAKFEPPFIPGSYIAARFEQMNFGSLPHPEGSTLITPHWSDWDDNIMRYSLAVGYKLAHNVLLKVAASEQVHEKSDLDKEDWTIRSILTISM